MTPERLKDLLDDFCEQNGGGYRSVETWPAPYGGISGELVWGRFDGAEVAGRQKQIQEFLKKRLLPAERSMISVVYAKGVREKAVETLQ